MVDSLMPLPFPPCVGLMLVHIVARVQETHVGTVDLRCKPCNTAVIPNGTPCERLRFCAVGSTGSLTRVVNKKVATVYRTVTLKAPRVRFGLYNCRAQIAPPLQNLLFCPNRFWLSVGQPTSTILLGFSVATPRLCSCCFFVHYVSLDFLTANLLTT